MNENCLSVPHSMSVYFHKSILLFLSSPIRRPDMLEHRYVGKALLSHDKLRSQCRKWKDGTTEQAGVQNDSCSPSKKTESRRRNVHQFNGWFRSGSHDQYVRCYERRCPPCRNPEPRNSTTYLLFATTSALQLMLERGIVVS